MEHEPSTLSPIQRSWRKKWMMGTLGYSFVAVLVSLRWFSYGPGMTRSGIITIYESKWVAVFVFIAGAAMLYYAAYAVATAVSGMATSREARLHLVFWALVPPFWFFIEWFFLVRNYEAQNVSLVRAGQDVVGRLWAAVLAILLAVKLGDLAAAKETRDPTNS